MENKAININISTYTILKIFLFLAGLFFVYLISDILILFFVALIISSAIAPWVDYMQKKGFPRFLGIISIYFILFVLVGLVVCLIVPPIIEQTIELSESYPQYFNQDDSFSLFGEMSKKTLVLNNLKKSFSLLTSSFEGATSQIFSTVSNVFGGIFSFFLVLVIVFYMTVEENAVKKIVWSIVPFEKQPFVIDIINKMQRKIGLWLRGQLILSLIIFALTYLALIIFQIKYALVLALIAGLTEFIPYLGPLIAAIPAVFLAFVQSPMLAVFVAVIYYVIQLVENNIIVPKLMQKVVGLNPVVSIVVLLVGFKIAGVLGAILAIPVATAASVFLQEIFFKKAKV